MHPMTMKKEELKEQANHIRNLKSQRKASKDNYDPSAAWRARQEGFDYRLAHIAYCLVRGRTYEQIEQPREENKISEYHWTKIDKLYGKLKQQVDEANDLWVKEHPPKEVTSG